MKEDWIDCKFETILKQSKEKHKPEKIENLFYVGLEHIEKGTGKLVYYVGFDEIKTLKNKFCPGQILYGKLRPYLNKVHLANTSGVCSTDILVFDVADCLVGQYALYFMLSREFVNDMSANSSGVNLPRVSTKHINNYSFPLPPLPIQRAIVTKIENLFASLNKGIEDLKKAQEQLKVYRQAVLKKAFEGELTREWREKQSSLPTAEELLEEVKQERQRFYEEQLEEWKNAVKEWQEKEKSGKRPSRISKPKQLSSPNNKELKNYEGIPDDWCWTRFCNVTYKIGDIDHKMPKSVNKGIPYLSTGNIGSNGIIDLKNAKNISREDFERLALKIKPSKGDIIFPRYGTIGRNVLIDFDKEFLVSYSCAIIKNIELLMVPKFVFYFSISPIVKQEIKKYTVETTQANIGIASIENFVFPLCSKEEQHQIVREIESRLSVCDKLEQSIEEGLEKAEALRQSILKKAFDGKLLTEAEIEKCKQEADYEPASALLERIRKEK